MSPLPRRPLRALRTTATTVATLAVALVGLSTVAPPAQADNVVTPGNFTGYGFDQCLTPTQAKMDAWHEHSPFSAVGIYISGKSRACRNQPNLTRTWVATQLARHWKLLPITLGPQASCLDRFPRYGDDPTINPSSRNNYVGARRQGWAEAESAVAAAGRLGIVPGSTLWYDLEGFTLSNTHCRESALRFLHSWTRGVHDLGYVSGVYSSAGSGIKMLDDARVERPGQFTLPDAIWIARWDGVANTSTSYISNKGWADGQRVKQYRGGHNETHGGVTINIDSNYLDVGTGSRKLAKRLYCSTVDLNLASWHRLRSGTTRTGEVKALQCLLRQRRLYAGKITGTFNSDLTAAMQAWQRRKGSPVSTTWTRQNWVQLHSAGNSRVAKFGTTGAFIQRLQRSLAAATGRTLAVDGAYFRSTETLVRTWQGEVGLPRTGVMSTRSWELLKSGRY
jgi:hypothetical protein